MSAERELEAFLLVDALAQDVLLVSDEEALEAVATDPLAPAPDRVRTILTETSASWRRSRLEAAREERQHRLGELNGNVVPLPASPSERRSMLHAAFFGDHPTATQLRAAHGRNMEEIPDADVEALLRQLIALGVIKPPPTGGASR